MINWIWEKIKPRVLELISINIKYSNDGIYDSIGRMTEELISMMDQKLAQNIVQINLGPEDIIVLPASTPDAVIEALQERGIGRTVAGIITANNVKILRLS